MLVGEVVGGIDKRGRWGDRFVGLFVIIYNIRYR
jgi:hypothetical protein